ncbi:MAG TPA: hypothetical protein VK932_22135, partial [Kofleriaceae bacterium]|nr:hypothetical protein [Kofleriaceae bacterium]
EPAPAPAEPAPAPAEPAAAPAAPAAEPAPSPTKPPAVEFTPVPVKQSALAKGVAKEMASALFPRSVLIAIIVIQAAVIAWLLVR